MLLCIEDLRPMPPSRPLARQEGARLQAAGSGCRQQVAHCKAAGRMAANCRLQGVQAWAGTGRTAATARLQAARSKAAGSRLYAARLQDARLQAARGHGWARSAHSGSFKVAGSRIQGRLQGGLPAARLQAASCRLQGAKRGHAQHAQRQGSRRGKSAALLHFGTQKQNQGYLRKTNGQKRPQAANTTRIASRRGVAPVEGRWWVSCSPDHPPTLRTSHRSQMVRTTSVYLF